jgi:hypothetical protein
MGGLYANHVETPLVITGSAEEFVKVCSVETTAEPSAPVHDMIVHAAGRLEADLPEGQMQHYHIAATIAADRLGSAAFRNIQFRLSKYTAATEAWTPIPGALVTFALANERVQSTAVHGDIHMVKGDQICLEVYNLEGTTDIRLWHLYLFAGGMVAHNGGA